MVVGTTECNLDRSLAHLWFHAVVRQGLPDIAHAAATDIVRIPMAVDHVRSLNLATSVGVGVFEALRQLDGPNFEEEV